MAPGARSAIPARVTSPNMLARRRVDLISAALRVAIVLSRSPIFLHDGLFRQVDHHGNGIRRRLTVGRGGCEDEPDDAIARFALLALATDQHLQVFPTHRALVPPLIERLHVR